MKSKLFTWSVWFLLAMLTIHQINRGGWYGGWHQKHTWNCQLVYKDPGGLFYFQRPNKEIFTMLFDNPPSLYLGIKLRDIT